MQSELGELFSELPERFLAMELDELTCGLFKWRTIKNLRCKGKIPADCFMKVSPRKIVIVKSRFLDWAEMYALGGK